jgi:hypothetical protein
MYRQDLLAQDRDWWWVVVNMVMNFGFLTRQESSISFPRKSLLHGARQ